MLRKLVSVSTSNLDIKVPISKLYTDRLLIVLISRTACRNDYSNDSNISPTVMAPLNSLSSIIIIEVILQNIQT